MIFLLDTQKVSQILRIQPLAAATTDGDFHWRTIADFYENRSRESSEFQRNQQLVPIKAEFLERERRKEYFFLGNLRMGSFIHGQTRRDFSKPEQLHKKNSIQPNKIRKTKNNKCAEIPKRIELVSSNRYEKLRSERNLCRNKTPLYCRRINL